MKEQGPERWHRFWRSKTLLLLAITSVLVVSWLCALLPTGTPSADSDRRAPPASDLRAVAGTPAESVVTDRTKIEDSTRDEGRQICVTHLVSGAPIAEARVFVVRGDGIVESVGQ